MGMSKSQAILLFMLVVPSIILSLYFLFGKRDIKSALQGAAMAFLLALCSILVAYAIRSGELVEPDFSVFYALSIVALALFVSVFEEFVFRGAVLGALVKYFSRVPVIFPLVAQAMLFVAFHPCSGKPLIYFVEIFAAGMFLGWAYLQTRSLWFSIGFHVGWDLAIVLLTGFHSRNLGHIKAVVVLNSHYAGVNEFIFLMAIGLGVLGFKKIQRTAPRISPQQVAAVGLPQP